MHRVPSVGRQMSSSGLHLSASQVQRGSSFAFRSPSPGPGSADTGAVKALVDEVIATELEQTLTKNFKRLAKGIPTETFSDHYAIDRNKGIYMQVTVYQGEPALGDQVMKSDHWENANKLSYYNFPGVINLRQVPTNREEFEYDLWGVGQPTVEGLLSVIRLLTLEKRYARIVWINLREEPVVYVSQLPFAPRDKDTLNINLEHLLGIEGLDLESMEGRLKADITALIRSTGKFVYYAQSATMANELREMPLEKCRGAILTLRELYNNIAFDEGVDIEYHRIPITDECAPEEKDFDEIVETIKDLSPDAAVVFNCQMGRGRTTTGLVCGYLISQMKKGGWTPAKTPPAPDPTKPDYSRGEYAVILQLIAALEDGELVKAQVDEAINVCSAMQNLRTAIAECKVNAENRAENRPAEFWDKRGRNYLERYWWLILFNAYLRKQAPKYSKSFSEWMKSKWGLRRMLRKIALA